MERETGDDEGARSAKAGRRGAGEAIPQVLRAYVDRIAPVGDAAWTALEPLFSRRMLAKGEHFAELGVPTRRFGLLASGWIRAYFPTPEGTEYNKHLFQGPAAVGDYASLLTDAPVEVAQQALTDCVVYQADYPSFLRLMDEHRDLERLARRYAEQLYLQLEQRELELATLTAGERYRRLVDRLPEIETALPQYQIAAYLGITPTQLSRIRRPKR